LTFTVRQARNRARDCLNLRPKCIKTPLRASVSSTNFPGVIPPDPRLKGEGRKGKREGGTRRKEGMRRKGRIEDGREGKGRRGGKRREGRKEG
jgi:hypothetical protein